MARIRVTGRHVEERQRPGLARRVSHSAESRQFGPKPGSVPHAPAEPAQQWFPSAQVRRVDVRPRGGGVRRPAPVRIEQVELEPRMIKCVTSASS
jgi:hypothetical protein